MDPITCRYCGEKVHVSPHDLPVRYREDAADQSQPRQFVIFGANYWLLHRCEVEDGQEPRFEK